MPLNTIGGRATVAAGALVAATTVASCTDAVAAPPSTPAPAASSTTARPSDTDRPSGVLVFAHDVAGKGDLRLTIGAYPPVTDGEQAAVDAAGKTPQYVGFGEEITLTLPAADYGVGLFDDLGASVGGPTTVDIVDGATERLTASALLGVAAAGPALPPTPPTPPAPGTPPAASAIPAIPVAPPPGNPPPADPEVARGVAVVFVHDAPGVPALRLSVGPYPGVNTPEQAEALGADQVLDSVFVTAGGQTSFTLPPGSYGAGLFDEQGKSVGEPREFEIVAGSSGETFLASELLG